MIAWTSVAFAQAGRLFGVSRIVLPELSTALTTAKDELLAFFTGEQSLAELGTGIQAAFASIAFDKIRTDMIAAIGLDQISWDFTNVKGTTVGTDIHTGVTHAVDKIEWFAGQTATLALKLWASVTAKFNAIDWSAIGTGPRQSSMASFLA